MTILLFRLTILLLIWMTIISQGRQAVPGWASRRGGVVCGVQVPFGVVDDNSCARHDRAAILFHRL
jgi:hypothetical protein